MTQPNEQACAHIRAAMEANDRAQKMYPIGSTMWHAHETIDDKLHDALRALGD